MAAGIYGIRYKLPQPHRFHGGLSTDSNVPGIREANLSYEARNEPEYDRFWQRSPGMGVASLGKMSIQCMQACQQQASSSWLSNFFADIVYIVCPRNLELAYTNIQVKIDMAGPEI